MHASVSWLITGGKHNDALFDFFRRLGGRQWEKPHLVDEKREAESFEW